MHATPQSSWTSRLLLAFVTIALASCGGSGGGGGGDTETPPEGFRVVESDPFDDELAVARDATITIVFSEDMRPETITSASFKVSESWTGRVVTGAISVDEDERSATLVPTSILALNTEYRILVTTDVVSRFNEPLRQDFEAFFRTVVTDTGPPPPPPPPPSLRLVHVGSMLTGRSSHTSTRLESGAVLVTGGWATSTELTDTAEVYDPFAREFTQLTGGLRIGRANHTATLLPDGKVLVTGGLTDDGAKVASSVEIYDPSQQTFTLTNPMTAPRAYHTATRLTDGRVLITGGASFNASGNLVSQRSAEIYDPSTGSFSALPNMAVYRSDHTATLLADGRVLIVGGHSTSRQAEVFDPAKDTFAATGGLMRVARSGHSATLLIGGTVLVYGGGSQSASIYSPGISRFDATPGSPLVDRTSHTADILATGRVVIVGGYAWVPTAVFHQTIEYFNGPPGSNTFVMAAELLTYPRALHRSTVLKNGDILVTGGASLDPLGLELSAAVLFTFR